MSARKVLVTALRRAVTADRIIIAGLVGNAVYSYYYTATVETRVEFWSARTHDEHRALRGLVDRMSYRVDGLDRHIDKHLLQHKGLDSRIERHLQQHQGRAVFKFPLWGKIEREERCG
jgi:hypothetical protein